MVITAAAGKAGENSSHNYVRVAAAARYLKIGRSTIYEWCRKRRAEGFPQPIKAGQRVSLLDLNDIDAFLLRAQA